MNEQGRFSLVFPQDPELLCSVDGSDYLHILPCVSSLPGAAFAQMLHGSTQISSALTPPSPFSSQKLDLHYRALPFVQIASSSAVKGLLYSKATGEQENLPV